jgi:hypothetical protein
MATRSLHIRRMLHGIFVAAALWVTGNSAADELQSRPVLVGNIKASQLPDSVQVADIVRGYRRSWSDGTILTVVLPSRKHPSFRQMDKSFFTGRGASLQRHWLRLVFSGRGNPPLYADDAEEMCELLRTTRGACAFFYGTVPAPCQSLPQSLSSKVE